MKTKSKITIILTCLLVEAVLLTGVYCLGRYKRYEGTSKIGNESLDNISGAKTDVNNASNNTDLAINLLNPNITIDALKMQTIEQLTENNKKKEVIIENFISRFNATEKTLKDFKENYTGPNDDYLWDLMIREAEELEAMSLDYRNIIAAYELEKKEE